MKVLNLDHDHPHIRVGDDRRELGVMKVRKHIFRGGGRYLLSNSQENFQFPHYAFT